MKRKRKNKMFKVKDEDGKIVMLYEDEYYSLLKLKMLINKPAIITLDELDKSSAKEGDNLISEFTS